MDYTFQKNVALIKQEITTRRNNLLRNRKIKADERIIAIYDEMLDVIAKYEEKKLEN